MMKDRIKIFSSNDANDLENQVNVFLETLSLPLVDIKFSQLASSKDTWFGTVMVIYKKRQL